MIKIMVCLLDIFLEAWVILGHLGSSWVSLGQLGSACVILDQSST